MGHSKMPVWSCWKSLSCLTFQSRWGMRTSPFGVIQLTMVPFRLLVSSDLAPEEPLCIFEVILCHIRELAKQHSRVRPIRSAIAHTSLSSPPRMWSSKSGDPLQRAVKMQYSCLSLEKYCMSVLNIDESAEMLNTHVSSRASSGLRSDSPIFVAWRRPVGISQMAENGLWAQSKSCRELARNNIVAMYSIQSLYMEWDGYRSLHCHMWPPLPQSDALVMQQLCKPMREWNMKGTIQVRGMGVK